MYSNKFFLLFFHASKSCICTNFTSVKYKFDQCSQTRCLQPIFYQNSRFFESLKKWCFSPTIMSFWAIIVTTQTPDFHVFFLKIYDFRPYPSRRLNLIYCYTFSICNCQAPGPGLFQVRSGLGLVLVKVQVKIVQKSEVSVISQK